MIFVQYSWFLYFFDKVFYRFRINFSGFITYGVFISLEFLLCCFVWCFLVVQSRLNVFWYWVFFFEYIVWYFQILKYLLNEMNIFFYQISGIFKDRYFVYICILGFRIWQGFIDIRVFKGFIVLAINFMIFCFVLCFSCFFRI